MFSPSQRLQEENMYNSRLQPISGYPMTSSVTCGGYSPPLVTSRAEPAYLSGNYVIKSDLDAYKDESRHTYSGSADYLQYRPGYSDSVTYRVVPKREMVDEARSMGELRGVTSLNDARPVHNEVRSGLGEVRATLGDIRGGFGEIRNSFGTVRETSGYIGNGYGAVGHEGTVHARAPAAHSSPIPWESATPDYHIHQQQYSYPGKSYITQSQPATIYMHISIKNYINL